MAARRCGLTSVNLNQHLAPCGTPRGAFSFLLREENMCQTDNTTESVQRALHEFLGFLARQVVMALNQSECAILSGEPKRDASCDKKRQRATPVRQTVKL